MAGPETVDGPLEGSRLECLADSPERGGQRPDRLAGEMVDEENRALICWFKQQAALKN